MRKVALTFIVGCFTIIACASYVFPAGDASPSGQETAIILYRDGKIGEAKAAFDKLVLEKPNDDGIKIWKALAQLEEARRMKESNVQGYKHLVVNSYATLKPLGARNGDNPAWYLAMAKAFWLNGRSNKAKKAIQKALFYRNDFAEAHFLLGDIAYDEAVNSPPPALTAGPGDNPMEDNKRVAQKVYNEILALRDLPSDYRAEALYKLGNIAMNFENRKEVARGWWEKAASAAPESQYGRLSKQKIEGEAVK